MVESPPGPGRAALPANVSVVVPTFNEAGNIVPLSERIGAALEGIPYELIFVDDSDDETPAILARVAASDSHVRYLHREGRRGLGTAVVDGIEMSRADVVAVIDADLQHPPELLPSMLEALQEADLVIPSRFVPGGSDGGLDPFRKLVSAVARHLGKFALRRIRGVSDPTSGYFMFRRAVVEGADLRPIGWKILLEVLVRGRYARVVEIPYEFAPRHAGESKLSLSEHRNYIAHLVKLASSSPADRRFYISNMVGVTGVAVNVLVYLLLLAFAFTTIAAAAGAMIAALVWNFALNDQLTWRHMHHLEWFRAVRYGTSSLVAIFIAVAVLALLNDVGRVNALAAYALALACAIAWNVVINNYWTWKPESDDPSKGFAVKHQVAG